jgi:hypothetical protein
MDEEIQREPELSEEHLQAISGGCGACGRDRALITRSTVRGNLYTRLSEIAQHFELPDLASGYSARARMLFGIAQDAQRRIDARHPQG